MKHNDGAFAACWNDGSQRQISEAKGYSTDSKGILKADVRSRYLQLSNKRLSVGWFFYIAMNKARVERKVWRERYELDLSMTLSEKGMWS